MKNLNLDYHDSRLQKITLKEVGKEDSVEFEFVNEDQNSILTLKLSGVAHLLVQDFMEGNIILQTCLFSGCDEGDLHHSRISHFFHRRFPKDLKEQQKIINSIIDGKQKYLEIWPTYGAQVFSVFSEFTESRVQPA
jgi:hypothetical protein